MSGNYDASSRPSSGEWQAILSSMGIKQGDGTAPKTEAPKQGKSNSMTATVGAEGIAGSQRTQGIRSSSLEAPPNANGLQPSSAPTMNVKTDSAVVSKAKNRGFFRKLFGKGKSQSSSSTAAAATASAASSHHPTTLQTHTHDPIATRLNNLLNVTANALSHEEGMALLANVGAGGFIYELNEDQSGGTFHFKPEDDIDKMLSFSFEIDQDTGNFKISTDKNVDEKGNRPKTEVSVSGDNPVRFAKEALHSLYDSHYSFRDLYSRNNLFPVAASKEHAHVMLKSAPEGSVATYPKEIGQTTHRIAVKGMDGEPVDWNAGIHPTGKGEYSLTSANGQHKVNSFNQFSDLMFQVKRNVLGGAARRYPRVGTRENTRARKQNLPHFIQDTSVKRRIPTQNFAVDRAKLGIIGGPRDIAIQPDGKHLILQQALRGCMPATTGMILLDAGYKDLSKIHFDIDLAKTSQVEGWIKSAGARPITTNLTGSEDHLPERLQELIAQNGPMVLQVDDAIIGSHVVVLDQIDLKKNEATIRDPYHGEQLVLELNALVQLAIGRFNGQAGEAIQVAQKASPQNET